MAERNILDVLAEMGKTFAGADLSRATNQAASLGADLGWILLGMGLITEEELADAYAQLHDLTLVGESEMSVQPEAAGRIPDGIIRKYNIYPVAVEGEDLWIAVCNPTGVKAAQAFARQEMIRVQVVLVTQSVMARLITGRQPGPAPAPARPSQPGSVRPEPAAPAARQTPAPQPAQRPVPQTAPPPPRPASQRPQPAPQPARPAAPPQGSSGADDGLGLVETPRGRTAEEETDAMFGQMLAVADESATIQIVDTILQHSVTHQVSDLHVSRSDAGLVVRYRRDGALQPQRLKLSGKNQEAVVSRLKVMAELDLAEKRQPQDGAFDYIARREERDVRYVCRVSIVPTHTGEKACLRLLEANARARSLDQLDLSWEALKSIRTLSRSPSGLFLFTGPTGSGKTTAAYGCLQEIANPAISVFTVEDPIEYTNEFYYQVQVHEKIGLSFGKVLRSILRQDPDVILVGEIRDSETAQIGAQAAQIGRLVISTIHTNDAPGTITRLADLGVARYAIASSLRGAVAIRLMRRLCKCKRPASHVSAELEAAREHFSLEDGEAFEPAGCDECENTGFKGRLPVAEVLTMDAKLADAVLAGESGFEIRKTAMETGFQPLLVDAWRRVLRGETAEKEVVRQLGTVL
ncbi:MAG: type II/IV secretion system protein [Candidatus Wallbacteria bacterium]|nr:type II/IV secretion system protein [Candidatus Wallbacteria bacterium]